MTASDLTASVTHGTAPAVLVAAVAGGWLAGGPGAVRMTLPEQRPLAPGRGRAQ